VDCGKAHKRVVIHVPMKVKHLHHTHTVYKPIHHALPVNIDDHHDFHVIKQHDSYGDDYHIAHGRMLESLWNKENNHPTSIYNLSHDNDNDDDEDEEYEDHRQSEYDHFEKLLKKRSKAKQKLYNNMLIGWKGRPDFDKIASEYFKNIKKHPIQHYDDDYEDRYAAYEDERGSHKK
jgi:hypothetical protein